MQVHVHKDVHARAILICLSTQVLQMSVCIQYIYMCVPMCIPANKHVGIPDSIVYSCVSEGLTACVYENVCGLVFVCYRCMCVC